MASPSAHIDEIRRVKFSIGASTPNPLASSLHQAIVHLSAELYQKDVHFISELIQNAEDNVYPEGVEPALELVLTQEDVTGVGAPATLLLFNNETGFEAKHVAALCAVGNSTKKGQRNEGYIGEKGIGFKSVFLVTHTPYIISNGYRIRFSDMESSAADIAYIVPEWVDKPTDETLRRFYRGAHSKLPRTTIALPLRGDKLAAVQEELRQLSPETIMFLKRITQLRVRDETRSIVGDLKIARSDSAHLNMGSDLEFSTMGLSVVREPEHLSEECKYYVSEHRFPVTASVAQRKEVKNWKITLAMPYLNRPSGQTSGDVYAFLPSQVKSGLPFIINADFLLVSSRETLRFDSPWNLGILACVPAAFLKVFRTLLFDDDQSKVESNYYGSSGRGDALTKIGAQHVYKYIPVDPIPRPELDSIRTAILSTLNDEEIVLVDADVGHRISSSLTSGNFFCKPALARQITDAFRRILKRAKTQGAIPPSLIDSSWYIVDGVVQRTYGGTIDKLGVPSMSWREYLAIVSDADWLMKLTEDLYFDVVDFLAIDLPNLAPYNSRCRTMVNQVRLLKYQGEDGSSSLANVREVTDKKLRIYISPSRQGGWLSEWVHKFKPWITVYFMPAKTAAVMERLITKPQRRDLKDWLRDDAQISDLSIRSYVEQLMNKLPEVGDSEFVLLVSKVLYGSIQERHLTMKFVSDHMHGNLARVPIVDESGSVRFIKKGDTVTSTLLPPRGSKWPILLDQHSRPQVIRMSDDYLKHHSSGRLMCPEDVVTCKHFLSKVFNATDLPELMVPPHSSLSAPTLSPQMTRDQSVLLLQWLAYAGKYQIGGIPTTFLASIKTTTWMKTEKHGVQRPEGCFLPIPELKAFFWTGDVPFLDESFYGSDILNSFKEALEGLKVVVKAEKGLDAVAKRILDKASGLDPRQPDLQQAIRFYSYLKKYDWRPSDSTVKIFVPGGSTIASLWRRADECLIRDKHKFFDGVRPVLENIYPKSLLPFFQTVLKVPAKERVDDYCKLWLTSWTSAGCPRNEEQCGLLWEKIAKKWKTCSDDVKLEFKAKALVLSRDRADSDQPFKLSPPAQTFIPDDLELQSLLMSDNSKAAPNFAWYPRRSETFEAELTEVYSEVGVQDLSSCVEVNFHFSAALQRNLQREEGLLSPGLFTAILGFLSKHSLPSSERQEIIAPLCTTVEVEIDSPFQRNYALSLPSSPDKLLVKKDAMAYWDKTTGKLFRLKKNHKLLQSPLTQREFETEFAVTIASGLLCQHPSIAPSLVDFLKLMVASRFEESIVKYELRRKNIRIYEDDTEFLNTYM